MQNAWVEFPEATWAENAFSGCFGFHPSAPEPALGTPGLALIPASPDARCAQHDKSEIVLLKIKL